MAERDDAPLADEPQPGAAPNDMPSGMPAGDDAAEPEPLGPGGDEEPDEGAESMPGIPTEGDDPYSAG
ncbi:MAG TPA: hypothetical protein VHF89_14935 [Solirubrobacteraceae bacterium]|nr:hypothetical protein [Solirubrobacteraceae bacterium]